MYKLFSIFSISSLLQGHAVNRSLAFMSEIPRTFKAVHRRALSTIGTTLMLSALLSACGGGGGGGGSDAPAPTSTAPIFSVLSSNFSVDEDFAAPQIVALVANATAITVSQSNTGVVTVTTSNSRFIVSSIANANGRTILTIRATNGAFSATTQVTVTVNAVNDPPTLAVSSSNISTVGGFSPITINTTASDIEDGALAFTVSESTTGVVRVGTSADAIILSNIPNVSGQTTLTVTAVDSSGSTVTQTIAVDVTITTSTSIPALSVSSTLVNEQEDFGTEVVIRTTATDADGDAITLSVSTSSRLVDVAISTPNNSTNTITNSITLSAVVNANGTATLTVRATDAGGQSTEVNIVVVVAAVNDAPTLTIPTLDLVLAEDFVGTRTVISAVDVDSNPLTVTVVESTTGVVTITTTASSVQVASILNVNGQTTLTITVNDGTVDTTAQVAVSVTAVNDPPTLSVSPNALTLNEDFATPEVITVTRTDIDGDTLTLTVAESTTGVVTVTTTASGVQVASILNANGQTTLTITVNDGTVDTTAQVAVSVTAVNDPPTLSVSPNALTLNEDFATPEVITVTRTDIDGDTLTLTVAESTTGVVTVTTTASGVQVASILNANGQTTLTITVNDGTVDTTAQVAVSVTAVNDAPTLTIPTLDLVLAEDFVGARTVISAVDVDSNPLTVTVVESTTGVVTITTTASSVQVASILNANGQTTLTITVNDGIVDTTAQVAVSVTAVNDPPVLTVSSNSISTVVGFSPITINTTASDIEDDNTSFIVMDSSTGVVRVTTSTNAIVLNAIPGASGQTTLTIRVVDSSGTTVTQSITLSVIIIPSVAPVLMVSTNLISVIEDFKTSVIIQTTATDVDGDTITVSVSASEPIVNAVVSTPVNGQGTFTNSITLTAISDANGTTTLTVLATDSGGQHHSTEIVVVVTSVEDTPTLTVTSNAVTVGLDPVVLTVSAFDVEDSTLSFSVSTGQGVVNTAITTTSLTITRLGLNASQIMLTLRTTDTGGLSTFTSIVVMPTPLLVVTTGGIKTLDFAWSAITSATHYQLQSNPDGHSGFTDLSTTGIVVSPNSTNIRQTTAHALVALHQYIPNVRNPQYSVGTCNTASSCGTSFRHNTVSLTNAQLNSLIGRLQASNAEAGDSFGASVSLSGDGNTLAVGAWAEDGSSTGVNGAQNNNSTDTGAVYVFRRIGGAWSQQAYIKASNTGDTDYFGFPVSLSSDGNTLAVGAYFDDSSSTGVNGAQNDNAINSGAVYVFRRIGGVWSQQAYIKASNTGRDDFFGWSVSLSADGNTLAVGALGEDSSSTGVNRAQDDNTASISAAVYLFRFSTGSSIWSQQAYIKASNAETFDRFGWSVSLSADGNTLAVGALREDSRSTGVNGAQDDNTVSNSGAVYVFRFNTTSSIWSQQAYIKASYTEWEDEFGNSVSLSADGNTLAVGARDEDSSSTGVNGAQNNNTASESGAVYVFRFSIGSSTWAQQAYIKASNTGADDNFGNSVSLSADGNILAVGATGEDGSATGIGGVDDNGTGNAGATYVFEFANGAWAQQAYIKATDTSVNVSFGASVSLSSNGNTLVVGANGVTNFEGAVYLY